MAEPKFSWDVMHNPSFFLPEKAFIPTSAATHDICAIESNDFLPLGKFNWFKNPIPTPNVFEEWNM